jgi:hypothetical protein
VVPGQDADATIGFALKGSFSGDYLIRVDADAPEVNVIPLANGRDGDNFRLYISSPIDTSVGSFGTAIQLRLAVRLEGFGWTAAAGGAATITPTPFIFGAGSESPTWVKATRTHLDFQAASMAHDIELFSLPAGGVIHAVKLKHSVAFAGTGISDYDISIGIAGDLDKYAPAFDVDNAPGDSNFSLSSILGSENHAAPTSIRIEADSAGANLDQSTAGSIDCWVLVSVAI